MFGCVVAAGSQRAQLSSVINWINFTRARARDWAQWSRALSSVCASVDATARLQAQARRMSIGTLGYAVYQIGYRGMSMRSAHRATRRGAR